ncbi:cytochrome P450, putative [Talaromyces stipitatus ATCC 10500]|uniref:Cytochrome P450, putative n=1 Tax=Talaromyces stipitatus (strain ATCC 10500 / CBS 375.48 / QM 6759 / NRRL 1006) TaxID=441959 RepID=B8MM40_TALSN|nr:cytochrome P450, putative [Talaromyces stipitatus ATCC 10500]EED13552.1 cytochrome P450, putative [Talaromyces stipitatus ATCC 10500]
MTLWYNLLVLAGTIACFRFLWVSFNANIPSAGPLASYSRFLWLFPREFRGSITQDLPDLHENLGPLIRISPNEISYYSLSTYEIVHGAGSKFRKDPKAYGAFVQGHHPALFSIIDSNEHSKRRRLMGQLYSRSKISNLEGLMTQHVSRWIKCLGTKHSKIDLGPACRALEADIVSEFSFGMAIGAINAWNDGKELAMKAVNDEMATWMPLLVHMPVLFDILSSLRSILKWTTGYQVPHNRHILDFRNWAEKAWSRALLEENPFHPNLIHTLTKSGLPPKTALSEAKENLGPGTDTTSATLAHIIWALAHNIEFQEQLHQDLKTIEFSTSMSSLEAVPKLRACVKEGIRWTGAAAVMLPRVVPQGGVELHGKFIPEGVILSSSPIWYLRDSIAFPNPTEYNPYRWLTPDGCENSKNQLRDDFYIPFSRGSNTCIGAQSAEASAKVHRSYRNNKWLDTCVASIKKRMGGCCPDRSFGHYADYEVKQTSMERTGCNWLPGGLNDINYFTTIDNHCLVICRVLNPSSFPLSFFSRSSQSIVLVISRRAWWLGDLSTPTCELLHGQLGVVFTMCTLRLPQGLQMFFDR